MIKKYDWLVNVSAPKEYQVCVYSGGLYYGNDNRMAPVPSGRTVGYGWGEDFSIEVVGDDLKEAPDTLELSWISFAENKDYTGKFALNVKLIDSLLNAGFPDESIPAGHVNFNEIKVGMAPGGVIVLWISGAGKQVEVGRYQAKETNDLDWKKAIPGYDGTMKEYGKHILAKLPEEIQQQIADNKIPYGKWDHWRRRFSWKPLITSEFKILQLTIFTFNKEMELLLDKRLNPSEYLQRGAVEKVYIMWLNDKNQEMRSQVDFDEEETDRIFSALKPGEHAELIFHIEKNGDVITSLKNETGIIPFKKAKFNTYTR